MSSHFGRHGALAPERRSGRQTLDDYLSFWRYSRRAIALVWSTHRTLTIALGILTFAAGLMPAGVAYIGKLIVDAVVAAIDANRAGAVPDYARTLALVAIEGLLVAALAGVQRGIGFCQSLLRTFPIEAGLDPQFKIIEGFERSLLYGQLYDAWIDQETRVHPSEEVVREWELLFTHAGYLFQIRDLILGLIDRRDLLEETGYDFGTLEEVEEKLIDALVAIRRCGDVVGDDAAQRVFAYVRETDPPPSGDIDRWLAYLHPIAASIREENLPRHGILKEALKILRGKESKGRSVYDYLVRHRAAIALLALTRRFLAFLDDEKRKLGVVDFDDLLLRTLAVLGDEHVLARARAQFDFIFVDEFQDTDRTQARIIDRLARDASGAYVAGKTIVVGDPKQSIYGFRRADPETYYRMTEDLVAGGAERRMLADQYRSDPPPLAVVNAMFPRLFPETLHDPNVFRPRYTPLRAARTESRRELDARTRRAVRVVLEHDRQLGRFAAGERFVAEYFARGGHDDGGHGGR